MTTEKQRAEIAVGIQRSLARLERSRDWLTLEQRVAIAEQARNLADALDRGRVLQPALCYSAPAAGQDVRSVWPAAVQDYLESSVQAPDRSLYAGAAPLALSSGRRAVFWGGLSIWLPSEGASRARPSE